MGEYLSPAVYVEEVSSGVKPIAGVGTSTGAFVGVAEKGPINEPKLITNWTQFVETYGSYIADGFLAYSLFQFFNEGGTKCYVVRVATDAAATASVNLADDQGVNTLKIDALSMGTHGNKIAIDVKEASEEPDNHFKLEVKYDENVIEVYDNLSMVEMVNGLPNINHVETRINGVSKWIVVEDLDSNTAAPGDRPAMRTELS